MKAFLRFSGWATLMFAVTWLIATPYQHGIAGVASVIAAPNAQIEWVDLQIFFPFDLSVYAALCLASSWASWPQRLRFLGIGIALLIGVEVVVLVIAMRSLMASGSASPAHAAETQRFVVGLIRVTGLVAAGATWTWFLGWQRLPPFAQALEARMKPAGGKKS